MILLWHNTEDIIPLIIFILVFTSPFVVLVIYEDYKESKKPKRCTCNGFFMHDERTDRIINPADYCPLHRKTK
jgi:hypothetical protein